MKKLLFALVLVGCSKTNPAEIMVKAQVPGATCADYGTIDGVSVAHCRIPGEQVVTGIAVYSAAHPFQFFPLKGVEQPKTQPSTPSVDAGVGDATTK